MTALEEITRWLRVNRASPGQEGKGLTRDQAAAISQDLRSGVTAADFIDAFEDCASECSSGYPSLAKVRRRAHGRASTRRAGSSGAVGADEKERRRQAGRDGFLAALRNDGKTEAEIDALRLADEELDSNWPRRLVVERFDYGVRLECEHMVPVLSGVGRMRRCRHCAELELEH